MIASTTPRSTSSLRIPCSTPSPERAPLASKKAAVPEWDSLERMLSIQP